MTSLIEKLIAIIAPNQCVSCGINYNILCDACRLTNLIPVQPVCCLCGAPSNDWLLCVPCGARSGLNRAWLGGEYEGVLATVIHALKFERAQAAYKPLSAVILSVLPYYNQWTIVPIPTAPARVRQRGYDQARLLARQVARARQLPYLEALWRKQDGRQVGATRAQRQKQSGEMFGVKPRAAVKGTHILLVDDVCTTGATLSAAACLLRQAGAAQVDAAVVAWKR